MNLKNKNGITIVALVITVVVMLILVGVTIEMGTKSIDESEKQDIITNMISIKTKAKIVKDKYNFKDIENLVGTTLLGNSNYNTGAIESILAKEKSDYYIWTQDDLNNQELSSIKVDEDNFYIIYYGDNSNGIEVYYSKGINGKYSLTELQED